MRLSSRRQSFFWKHRGVPRPPQRALEHPDYPRLRHLNPQHTELDPATHRSRSGHIGIWASVCQGLVGAGGDTNIGWGRSINQRWTVRNMRTCTLNPSPAFIEAEVQKDNVRKCIARNRFRQKVYMITAVKVATSAKGFTAYMQKRSFDGRLGGHGTPWGVPVGPGPRFEMSGSSGTAIGFEDAADFVFAFQLREINVKKTGEVKHKQFRDGDFFGLDDPDREERREKNQAVQVLGLSDADGGDEFDLEEMEAVEEENSEECICVKLDE